MNKNKSSIKLVTWKHLIWSGICIILGAILSTFVLGEYASTGQLIFAAIVSIIIAVSIVALITYYANRPEK